MIKRSEQEWRALFAQQAASDISAQQFCKANGLCPKHFSVRKKQLGLRGSRTENAFVRVASAAPAVRDASVVTPSRVMIRHECTTLTFDAFPSAIWLAQLLRALA
ncbi:MAG: IS66 family insertion sequence element accessory protein TnpB [Pseudomonadota bacterium]